MPTYTPIASQTLTSASTTVTFGGIPQTYQDLILVISGTQTSGSASSPSIQFNGDTTVANYYSHTTKGNGTVATSSAEASCYMKNIFPGANQTSSVFGNYIIDVLDYNNSNKYKTVRYLGGVNANGSGQINIGSNLWKNTNAITSVLLAVDGSWTQYSSIALYGVKA